MFGFFKQKPLQPNLDHAAPAYATIAQLRQSKPDQDLSNVVEALMLLYENEGASKHAASSAFWGAQVAMSDDLDHFRVATKLGNGLPSHGMENADEKERERFEATVAGRHRLAFLLHRQPSMFDDMLKLLGRFA